MYVHPSSAIIDSADYLAEIDWDQVLVKSEDGEISQSDTKRAFTLALRNHLKAKGLIKDGRPSKTRYDAGNILRAAYFAFTHLAKGEPSPRAGLIELLYATLQQMQVPFADYERAKKIVRSCLDLPSSPLVVGRDGSKFEGSHVELRGPAINPQKFVSWADMQNVLTGRTAVVEDEPKSKPKGKNEKKKRAA